LNGLNYNTQSKIEKEEKFIVGGDQLPQRNKKERIRITLQSKKTQIKLPNMAKHFSICKLIVDLKLKF
tara:strand:- start:276 stop:479 length:204 start_codon:yes stop_codon:yes gene_type:complete